MKSLAYIAGRFYQMRSKRALNAYHALRVKAEKYFTKAGL